jgi:hypothetical protein
MLVNIQMFENSKFRPSKDFVLSTLLFHCRQTFGLDNNVATQRRLVSLMMMTFGNSPFHRQGYSAVPPLSPGRFFGKEADAFLHNFEA